jgi:hypothetical protein
MSELPKNNVRVAKQQWEIQDIGSEQLPKKS